MDLLEYQGKWLFRKHGVPVPDGRPVGSVGEAVRAAKELGFPVVMKAHGEGLRHRRGVLRGDRVRPLGEEADGDALAKLPNVHIETTMLGAAERVVELAG